MSASSAQSPREHDDRVGAVAEVLSEAQRWGLLGSRPIAAVIQHADAFVAAVQVSPNHRGAGDGTRRRRVVDLGSGGGVPGLVVAARCPDTDVVLVDRRGRSTDFLRRVVGRLGWVTQVHVVDADVGDLVKDPAWRQAADVVTARGFGPPDQTLAFGVDLVRPGGWIVISEPPPGVPDRWGAALLDRVGVERCSPPPDGAAGVVVFVSRGS